MTDNSAEVAVGTEQVAEDGPLTVSKHEIPGYEYGILFSSGMLASMIVAMLVAAVTENAGIAFMVASGASIALAVYCLYLKFVNGGAQSE